MNTLASVLNGPRSTRFRDVRLVLLGLGVLAALLLAGGCGDDPADPSFQQPPAPATPDWLFDVYGRSGDDVFVCGNNGAMYHYDGTSWTAQDLGTTAAITALSPDADGASVYAVGHGGRIWRASGTAWSSMSSGTSQNLYGIGSFGGAMHAVGWAGTIRRLNGSAWGGAGGTMLILDENDDPVDTLLVAEDIASLTVVNNYFLGGAYNDPEYEPDLDVEQVGILGTKGMVMATNTTPHTGDWVLRPLRGEDEARAPNEWILSTLSDARPDSIGRNFLGTTEGWLFQLTVDDLGKRVWNKFFPSFTADRAAGINAIWADGARNVYVVTDEGDVWFQTNDYNLREGRGSRHLLYDGRYRLTGIWGTGPDNLFITAFQENVVLRASHDQATHEFTVTFEQLPAVGKAAPSAAAGDVRPEDLPDEFLGRPLR